MVNPQGKDVILDRGTIKHTLEGAGILDSSVTSENFGGLDDRGAEFNFLLLHVNTVTTMSVIGLVALWGNIWRAMTCCRCTMGPRHDQSMYEP